MGSSPAALGQTLIEQLGRMPSTQEKLEYLYHLLRHHFAFVHRIGIAAVDRQSRSLQMFAHILDAAKPSSSYQYLLGMMKPEGHGHPPWEEGYQSSRTLLPQVDGALSRFVFLNSCDPAAFADPLPSDLTAIAQQFSQLADARGPGK